MARTQRLALGRHQTLRVASREDDGVWLDGGDAQLFLPARSAPDDVAVGSMLEVFVYTDGEGVPQATTAAPAGSLGETVFLQCVAVTRGGAYLDWGIPKDLFVPGKEMERPMVKGRRYVSSICLDTRGERLMASTRVSQHLDYEAPDVEIGDEVDVLVFGEIEAGAQVVVNRRYRGLVHHTKVHRELPIGTSVVGYVANVREDNRIDVELTRRGAAATSDAQEVLLAALHRAGGQLALHDRSSPEEIRRALGISKKAFKRAAGGLYKARRIVIDDDGIRLVED